MTLPPEEAIHSIDAPPSTNPRASTCPAWPQVEGGDWDAQDSSVRLDAVFDAKDLRVPNPIVRRWNVIASYTHLYWGEQDPLRLFE